MGVTIKDIAEHCRVSVGTVDRALNNRSGISEKTKNRILKAAEELNYHPNYMGQSLATGRTMTIGMVCFDLYNNFFPELIDTIERHAKEKGYFIYLILTHREFKLEKEGLQYLSERQVDGIILFPIGLSKEYIQALYDLKLHGRVYRLHPSLFFVHDLVSAYTKTDSMKLVVHMQQYH